MRKAALTRSDGVDCQSRRREARRLATSAVVLGPCEYAPLCGDEVDSGLFLIFYGGRTRCQAIMLITYGMIW